MNSNKFSPFNDYIIVQLNKSVEARTSSGLFIPESKDENIARGKVIAVGQGKLLENGERYLPSVKTGQTVVFNKFQGVQFSDENDKYVALKEEFVLFSVEE